MVMIPAESLILHIKYYNNNNNKFEECLRIYHLQYVADLLLKHALLFEVHLLPHWCIISPELSIMRHMFSSGQMSSLYTACELFRALKALRKCIRKRMNFFPLLQVAFLGYFFPSCFRLFKPVFVFLTQSTQEISAQFAYSGPQGTVKPFMCEYLTNQQIAR